MYALFAQNQNYVIERRSEARIRLENKKIDSWNVEIKKKMERLVNFDPEEIFKLSEDSSVDFDNNTRPLKLDDSIFSHRKLSTFTSAQLKADGKGNFVTRKINMYRQIIKWLDVITTLMITISTLLAQVDNLYYYDLNLELRTTTIQVVNCILGKNFSNYNATLVDQILKVPNYLSTINQESYESVYLNLVIDDYSKNIRYVVFFLSVISVILIILSRWFEYVRNYIYRKNEVPFYKTSLFWILLFEAVLAMLIPYPNMNSYVLYREFGSPLIIPISSIFSVFSMLRVYFFIKLFKHLTRWTSPLSEIICEKFVCEANTNYAFKAFQKENPFKMLFFIFIVSCYCFGMGVRTFELYYWENFNYEQNWRYQWNAMWFVFVSMTTVGYGDFYPKTQFGRAIAILACLVGVYFVSMMMVFLTQKSLKNEKEEKAYKLITRLKFRNQNKNLHSNLVYNYFQLILLKSKKRRELIDDVYFDVESKYKKRCLINDIRSIKHFKKIIKSCDLIPTKEQLLDISEKLDSDIKGIREELCALKNINDSFKMFTDDQLEIVDYLRKNIYAGKLLYEMIKKSKKFGKLNNLNFQKYIQGIDFTHEDIQENISHEVRRKTNPQQFDEKSIAKIVEMKIGEEDGTKQDETDEEDDLLAENEFYEDKIRLYFDFMFAKIRKKSSSKKTTRTRLISDRVIERGLTRRDQIKKKLVKLSKKNLNSYTDSLLSSPILNNKK